MNKYHNSSIYKLVLNDEVYYGSTTESVSKRFSNHKVLYNRYKDGKIKKRCSSFALFEKDFDNVKWELVEAFSCDALSDLHKRERYYIENNTCINKNTPATTRQETQKKWREANIEEQHQKANSKMVCECGGKYTRANKSAHFKTTKHILFQN
jgi:hypothetical protein